MSVVYTSMPILERVFEELPKQYRIQRVPVMVTVVSVEQIGVANFIPSCFSSESERWFSLVNDLISSTLIRSVESSMHLFNLMTVSDKSGDNCSQTHSGFAKLWRSRKRLLS